MNDPYREVIWRLTQLENRIKQLEERQQKADDKQDTIILLLFGSLVTLLVFSLGTVVTLITTRGR
jgi:tetrahydromethanopterin S-methyltransferase subunit G